MNWKSISDDPTSAAVRSAVHAELISRRKRVTGSMNFLREFVEGHRVLDIGIVEHDAGHLNSPSWKHAFICRWAAYSLGIDVIPAALALLKSRGFNVREVDATSDIDLGERFDRVFIGDVIEHVDNPVQVLKFAARHLTPDGQILVTTPNPYWILFIWNTLRSGTYLSNADHISWVSPSAALELGRRAGLVLQKYCLLQGDQAPIKRLSRRIANRLFPNSELFSSKFFYTFTK